MQHVPSAPLSPKGDFPQNKETTDQGTMSLTSSQQNSVGTHASTDEEEMHPSWDDEVLFNEDKSNESKKITKDDFELMTVIGKGSFGKVPSLIPIVFD